jgi:hypothetical protein
VKMCVHKNFGSLQNLEMILFFNLNAAERRILHIM